MCIMCPIYKLCINGEIQDGDQKSDQKSGNNIFSSEVSVTRNSIWPPGWLISNLLAFEYLDHIDSETELLDIHIWAIPFYTLQLQRIA